MCIAIESKCSQCCAHSNRELRRDMFNLSSLLRWQSHLQKTHRIPSLALDHQFCLEGLNDEFRAGGAASDIDVGNSLILLVLKKIDRGAQFAAQRQYQRL